MLRTRNCLLAALLALTGCTTVRPESDPVILDLNRSAAQISQQLTALSASKPAAHVATYQTPQTGPLATPITLAWSGPLVPAVKTVADLIGFHVQVTGREPSLPVLVRIDAEHRPAFLCLQDMGWQSGKYAGINVLPARRLVQIVYISPYTDKETHH